MIRLLIQGERKKEEKIEARSYFERSNRTKLTKSPTADSRTNDQDYTIQEYQSLKHPTETEGIHRLVSNEAAAMSCRKRGNEIRAAYLKCIEVKGETELEVSRDPAMIMSQLC